MADGTTATNKRFPALGVGIGLALIGGVVALFLWRDRAPAWPGRTGGERRILVAPFRVDSAPAGWTAQGFSESLAVRLRAEGGVNAQARAARESEVDYVVEGDIATADGRAVIALPSGPTGHQRRPRRRRWGLLTDTAGLAGVVLVAGLGARGTESCAGVLHLDGKPRRTTRRGSALSSPTSRFERFTTTPPALRGINTQRRT
jgi:hypothetical protein